MKGFPSMQEYLDQSGILETGSQEEILATKKAYRKLYKRWHKKMRRQAFKEFHPAFAPDEVALLKKAAAQHGVSVTAFLKQSSLAYIKRVFLLPAPDQVGRLEVVLNQCYQSIKKAGEGPGGDRIRNLNLLRNIEMMEQEIRKTLRNPMLLEVALEDRLRCDPSFAQKLTLLLQDHYASNQKYQ